MSDSKDYLTISNGEVTNMDENGEHYHAGYPFHEKFDPPVAYPADEEYEGKNEEYVPHIRSFITQSPAL